MATNASVLIVGVQGARNALQGLGVSVHDLRPAMDSIGKSAVRFFSGQVFASRGQALGEPWAALDPRYAAWKARKYPGRPPLVKSGAMMRGFQSEATNMSVKVGNKTSYFRYHQLGEGVPQRLMIGVYDSLASDSLEAVKQAIRQAMARSRG